MKKKELARLYFPGSEEKQAVNKLNGWIKNCPDLVKELEATGYSKNSKTFTPKQIALIYYYLGDP